MIAKTGFEDFLEPPNGISSHDTLSAMLGRLNPTKFAELFTAWVEAALSSLAGKHIAIDGKALRGCAGNPAFNQRLCQRGTTDLETGID